MPDITMCKGQNCPLKENCYRYKAKPSLYQSYFMEAPFKNRECNHYWEIVKSKIDKLRSNTTKK